MRTTVISMRRRVRRVGVLVVALVLAGTVSPALAPAHAQLGVLETSPHVLLLGDSLCNGARQLGGLDRLAADSTLRVDFRCRGGMDLAWGLDQVRGMDVVPAVVVVELGTNPTGSTATFRAEAEDLVGQLQSKGAESITWLTAHVIREGLFDYTGQNEVIRSLPGVTVAEWAAVLEADHSLFSGDGIHYTTEGYRQFAEYLLDHMWGDSLSANAAVERLRQQVARLYLATFQRQPDPQGEWFWTVARWYGVQLTTVADLFVASPEFRARYGAATPEVLVDLVYQNVLGRDPDPEGAGFWVGALLGGLRHGALIIGFSESAEFKAATTP